jgi:flagellar biosynthesis protein FliR
VPENPFAFTPQQAAAFILVLMRTAGLFLTSPLFSSRNIPSMLKGAWALLMAFLLFTVVPIPQEIPIAGAPFGFAVARELLVGFVIGLAAYLMFVGIQLAGQVVDIQMGFGMVNIIDPMSSAQVSVMGQYFYLVATLVFLAVDGHHLLLRALADSFELVPLGQAAFTPTLAGLFNEKAAGIFLVAFRVGAPVVGALFLTNLALGVLARTVPQMNVFIVGMPLNVAVGLLTAALSMGFYAYVLQGIFHGLHRDLGLLLHAMQ